MKSTYPNEAFEVFAILEIVGIGKGIIPELKEENLLEIFAKPDESEEEVLYPTLQNVVDESGNLEGVNRIYLAPDSIIEMYAYMSRQGIILHGDPATTDFSTFKIGRFNSYRDAVELGFTWFDDRVVFSNDTTVGGLEYEDEMFLARNYKTIVSHGFVNKPYVSRVTDYDQRIVGGVFTPLEEDSGKLFLFYNTTSIIIAFTFTFEFKAQMISCGLGKVTLVADAANSIDFVSKANSNTLVIEPKGCVSVSNGFAGDIFQVWGDIYYNPDYESGVYEPVLNFLENTSAPPAGGTANHGCYTRIGKIVQGVVNVRLMISALNIDSYFEIPLPLIPSKSRGIMMGTHGSFSTNVKGGVVDFSASASNFIRMKANKTDGLANELLVCNLSFCYELQ